MKGPGLWEETGRARRIGSRIVKHGRMLLLAAGLLLVLCNVSRGAVAEITGKVVGLRGDIVTIRLDSPGTPTVGDLVMLFSRVAGEAIPVGTWRVSAVISDGMVEASPVEMLGPPSLRAEAVITSNAGKGGGKGGTAASDSVTADSIFSRAMEYRDGSGVAKDLSRALELLEQAAALGHAEAAEMAGTAHERGFGTVPDDRKALGYYRQAAEAGRPLGQNNYGAFLNQGRGGAARDVDQAIAWYRKAAEQGHAMAQANLCRQYYMGEGIEKDYGAALRLCREAAAQGEPSAFDSLGWIYQFGLGIEKDLSLAFQNYERAAQLGHMNGQNNLAYMYEQGWGTSQDYQSALYWYGKAAALGSPYAEWNLGRMFQTGTGVAVDMGQAISHYQSAARAGHEPAQEKLKELGRTW